MSAEGRRQPTRALLLADEHHADVPGFVATVTNSTKCLQLLPVQLLLLIVEFAIWGYAAYAASKAGVVMLSEQMSLEWGKEGIRVNAISPGFIDAGMSSDHYVDPVERKKREGMVPIQKIGSAEDIANVVMFLLSDDSSYVHGENIVVDGGVMNSVLANIGRS